MKRVMVGEELERKELEYFGTCMEHGRLYVIGRNAKNMLEPIPAIYCKVVDSSPSTTWNYWLGRTVEIKKPMEKRTPNGMWEWTEEMNYLDGETRKVEEIRFDGSLIIDGFAVHESWVKEVE